MYREYLFLISFSRLFEILTYVIKLFPFDLGLKQTWICVKATALHIVTIDDCFMCYQLQLVSMLHNI